MPYGALGRRMVAMDRGEVGSGRRVLVGVTGLTCVEVAIAVGLYQRAPVSPERIVTFVGTGIAYSAVALAVWWRRPANRIWWMLVIAGTLWFAQVLVLSDLRAMAWLGEGLHERYLVVLFHIALAMPTGRLASKADRRVVAASYGAAVVVGVIDVATGYACAGPSSVCAGPVELSDLSGASRALALAGRVIVLSVVVWAVVAIEHRLHRADGATARSAAPVLAALVIRGVAVVAADLGVWPDTPVATWLLFATALALPLAVGAGLLLVELHRGQITQLVVAVDRGLSPSQLRDALALCLGDETLRLAFPAGGGYVDPDGRPFQPGGAGRAVTSVERDGTTIAMLTTPCP
jgi:hypothetical protein